MKNSIILHCNSAGISPFFPPVSQTDAVGRNTSFIGQNSTLRLMAPNCVASSLGPVLSCLHEANSENPSGLLHNHSSTEPIFTAFWSPADTA